MPPVELEVFGGFTTELFFEHPKRRRKREAEKS